jgi:uncharacterized protein
MGPDSIVAKGKGEHRLIRLSREKTIRLSHVITDVLVSMSNVEFVEDRDTIRQKAVQILQELLKEEEAVDTEVRKKISSQKKEILEGSEEWDVLYRKYYADEMRRMGIAHQPHEK